MNETSAAVPRAEHTPTLTWRAYVARAITWSAALAFVALVVNGAVIMLVTGEPAKNAAWVDVLSWACAAGTMVLIGLIAVCYAFVLIGQAVGWVEENINERK